MLGAFLGNFQGKVAGVYNFLLYAGDFVSEYQGVTLPFSGFEGV